MLKKDLIDAVSADTGVAKKVIREVMDSIAHHTTETLIQRGEVMLFGLGKMSVSKRGEKIARNIRTGERVVVPPRLAVVMSPNASIVKAVNAPGSV